MDFQCPEDLNSRTTLWIFSVRKACFVTAAFHGYFHLHFISVEKQNSCTRTAESRWRLLEVFVQTYP